MKNTYFNLGYVKKRILAVLGVSYGSDGDILYSGSRKAEIEAGMADAIYSALVEMYELFGKADSAPFIDSSVSDDLEIPLDGTPLEALICLAASKLCTEQEANTYTRLLYKYKDLCEGMYQIKIDKKGRNSFYASAERRGIV